MDLLWKISLPQFNLKWLWLQIFCQAKKFAFWNRISKNYSSSKAALQSRASILAWQSQDFRIDAPMQSAFLKEIWIKKSPQRYIFLAFFQNSEWNCFKNEKLHVSLQVIASIKFSHINHSWEIRFLKIIVFFQYFIIKKKT